jgi:hypothetical protein
MSSLADDREEQLAERELALSNARAALRAEREQIAHDRALADRLLAEARDTQREAKRLRDRTKRLAERFVRRVKHQNAAAERQQEEAAKKLTIDRQRLTAATTHFDRIRTEYHVSAAAARDRLREAWNSVRAQQKRAAQEWIETNRHHAEEDAILTKRAEELALQEKVLSDNRARIEAETAGFREEAAALETRIQNSRTALAELELRRDRARVELLGIEVPGELTNSDGTDDLTAREQLLNREKAAVAALKDSLERETADVNDHRRLVAEQLNMLADARSKWRQAEQQTVIEMEQLARELGQRDHELAIREQQLIRADIRRRDEAYNLWQLRLHLETWQTKLTAFEMRWHTEREQLETDLERRVSIITRRETDLESAFGTWEKARANERDRLRAELALWADDRRRLATAAAAFDGQRHELLGELGQHAARALAAEELVARAIQDSGSNRAKRRLAVLRQRWESVFERKAKEIDRRGNAAALERDKLDERYIALQTLLKEVVEREAAANNREAANLLLKGTTIQELSAGGTIPAARSASQTTEVIALRNEVERLASILLEVELPEPPEPPASELPWAVDEPEETPSSSEVLPFGAEVRAA